MPNGEIWEKLCFCHICLQYFALHAKKEDPVVKLYTLSGFSHNTPLKYNESTLIKKLLTFSPASFNLIPQAIHPFAMFMSANPDQDPVLL
jgi:hypothetical protein